MTKPTSKDKILESQKIYEAAAKGGWILDDNSELPGAFKLGTVWLAVPPSQITVSEVNENETVNTIRTPSDPSKKTGLQEVRIEVEIFFPSLQDINGRLRPMLAQFMRAPFLPLENQHIRSLIIPQLIWSGPTEEPRVDPRSPIPWHNKVYTREASKDGKKGRWNRTNEEFQRAVETEFLGIHDQYASKILQLEKSLENLQAETYTICDKIDAQCNVFDQAFSPVNELHTATLSIKESRTPYSESVKVTINRIDTLIKAHATIFDPLIANNVYTQQQVSGIILQFKEWAFRLDEIYRTYQANSAEINKLNDKKINLNIETVGAKLIQNYEDTKDLNEGLSLAIALRSLAISSIPGFPECLQCNLTLSAFNFSPYSEDFSFLVNIEDSLKQTIYANAKLNALYPEEIRTQMGKNVIYKEPSVTTTKDLARSKPFLAYIAPLLSPDGIPYTTEVDMMVDRDQTIDYEKEYDTIKCGFNFISPENWLRPVTDPEHLHTLTFEYELTELSGAEKTALENTIQGMQGDAQLLIDQLLRAIVDPSIIGRIKREFETLMYHISEIITFRRTKERLNFYSEKLSNLMSQEVVSPFTTKEALNPILGEKFKLIRGEYYKLETFVKFFDTLVVKNVVGKDIINKLSKIFEAQSLAFYGKQNLYRFQFTEDEDTVIAGISAAYNTKMATIPLLSHVIPTMQYMGKGSWNIQINIQTCNENLLKILRSLSQIASTSRVLRNQTEDQKWINQLNSLYFNPGAKANGILKMIGVHHCLFDSFVYETIRDKPGWFNISMKLIQSDLDMSLYETVLPVSFYPQDVVDDLKELLLKVYTWKHNPAKYKDKIEKYPYISKYVFSQLRQFVFGFASNMLNGGDIQNTKVLQLADDLITSSKTVYNDAKAKGLDVALSDTTLIDDKTVEKILNNGFQEGQFNEEIQAGFDNQLLKRSDVPYTSSRIGSGDPFGNLAYASFNNYSTTRRENKNYTIGRNSKIVRRPEDTILTDEGMIIPRAVLTKRQENPGLVTVNGNDSIGKFGFNNLRWTLKQLLLQQLAIRCLSVAREEVLKLFINSGKIKNDKESILAFKKHMIPSWTVNEKIDNVVNDYYSNYLDLMLPSYQGGLLSTPADFYYKRFNDFFNFKFIEQRITSTFDAYTKSWRYQLVYDLALLDKIRKNGTFPKELFVLTDAELNDLKISIYYTRKEMELASIQAGIGYYRYQPPEDIRNAAWNIIVKDKNTELGYPVNNPSTTYEDKVMAQITDKDPTRFNTLKEIAEGMEEDYRDQLEIRRKWGLNNISDKERAIRISMAADSIYGFWNKYGDEIKKMSIKEKDQLVFRDEVESLKDLQAYKSNRDIKIAMGISAALKLGAINENLRRQDEWSTKNKINGVDQNLDELSIRRAVGVAELEMLARMPSTNLFGIVSPYSLANNKLLAQRVKNQYNITTLKNKIRTMERAYPTVKLYFIEEDSREWGMIDDYYIYNAVQSIEVIKSKYAASNIATITVSNTSGNLSDAFSSVREEAPLNDGTINEQRVFSLYLKEGTTIMIKAGFDNNPEMLDTIFYGKVVSCQLGDIVSIVAQSFGTELLEPLNKGIRKNLGFHSPCRTHGDVIAWAMGTMSGLDHFGSTNNLERLGLMNVHGDTPYYSPQKYRTWDMLRKIHPITDFYFKFAVYDPRLENVFVPYSKICMSPFSRLLVNGLFSLEKNDDWKKALLIAGFSIVIVAALIFFPLVLPGIAATQGAIASASIATAYAGATTAVGSGIATGAAIAGYALLTSPAIGVSVFLISWKGIILTLAFASLAVLLAKGIMDGLFYKATFDWVIRDQNMWDLLNEMALYWDDYIVTTLPYNNFIPGLYRETLYFGSRDGYYKFTDVFDEKEQTSALQKRIFDQKSKFARYINPQNAQTLFSESEAVSKKYKSLIDKKQKLDQKGKHFNSDDQYEFERLGKRNTELAEIKNYLLRFYDPNTKKVLRQTVEENEIRTISDSSHAIDDNYIMLAIDNPTDLTITKPDKNGDVSFVPIKGYNNVVNYYHVDSYSHIIENNIRESAEDISNRVIVKFPNEPTTGDTQSFQTQEFFADDTIKGGNLKTYVSEQYNIDPLSFPVVPNDLARWLDYQTIVNKKYMVGNMPRVFTVGYNILANSMRNMYRGDIRVIGMPFIKPYDIVYINDFKNSMWGPIEVETIKHRFNMQEGFVTEIVPNAIITTMKPAKKMELAYMQGMYIPLLPFLGNCMEMNLWERLKSQGSNGQWGWYVADAAAALPAALITMGAFNAGGPVGAIIAGTAFATVGISMMFSLWDWSLGKHMGRDIIHLTGLWRGTRPMSAGLEGAYKENIAVNMMDKFLNIVDFEATFGQ